MTVSKRVLALISTLALSGESIGYRGREGLELLAGVAVHTEIAAKRVADLVATFAGVFAEHEHFPFAAQLVDSGAMVARHREDEIGVLHQLARQEPGPVPGEIEAALEPDEICPFRCGRAVPGTCPSGTHRDLESPLLQRALEEG
jgi:hypothetical protein